MPNLSIVGGTEHGPQYWLSPVPEGCQLCSRPFLGIMYDARIRTGQWANMCSSCHRSYGVGLGLGRGQRYMLQKNGKWLKVGG